MRQTAVTVLIGLGSNLGDRRETIQNAWRRLGEFESVFPIALSHIITTKPVGGPSGQPDFLNAAGVLKTFLDPFEFLDLLNQIEKEQKRLRHQFWGARTLDLDLLLYGKEIIFSQRLIVPHPRMIWRSFVLTPAVEIASEMRHPIMNLTLRELADLAEMNLRLASISFYSFSGM